MPDLRLNALCLLTCALISGTPLVTVAADSDGELARLRDAIATNAEDGNSHYQLGTLLMDREGNLSEAQRHFEKAAELNFQPLGAAYRLSRIYALLDRKQDALLQIEKMADGGFGLINLVDDQADYASLQDDARFISAVETIRGNRYPCSVDDRHHAFDFWIGEWNVTANGQFAGSNSIAPILGHCVIYEQWTSVNGNEGKSFNYYDPGHDHWRQIWIGDGGTFIEFTGVARDGGIFYTAETINPADGSRTLHKFEFTQLDDGVVRQFWQTSTDDGATYTTIWDGQYARKTAE